MRRTEGACAVPGCDRPPTTRQLCSSHYAYLQRTGTWPTHLLENRDPAVRFWAKVEKSDGCWLWKGSTDGSGRYGSFQYDGRVQRAHRVSLLLVGVEVPDGMDVDHLCRVTQCVRPDHLEVVTHLTNVQRGIRGSITHCPKGHPYEGDNLYVIPSSGGRACRTCMREGQVERQRRYRARQKAKGRAV